VTTSNYFWAPACGWTSIPISECAFPTGAGYMSICGAIEPRSQIKQRPPNKRMQLTKLRAAPVLQAEVPPCAPAGRMDGGTASQLIRGVGPTKEWRSTERTHREGRTMANRGLAVASGVDGGTASSPRPRPRI
jgi:hypothetical protein